MLPGNETYLETIGVTALLVENVLFQFYPTKSIMINSRGAHFTCIEKEKTVQQLNSLVVLFSFKH